MFITLLASAVLTPTSLPAQPKTLTWEGLYVEGCSCAPPCPCELVGVAMGCEGVGVIVFQKGAYGTTDLAGLKIAYGTQPGSWVALFIEAKNAQQQKAGTMLATNLFKEYGKVVLLRDAKISITGSKGRYTATVDGGKVFTLKTEPILGGDGKNPISISNVHNPARPTVFLGKTVRCQYSDGERSFEIHDTNSYFNDHARSKVQI
jgi:hypothetical protein